MKAIRYFVGILLFCGMCFGLEAAERPGKAKKEKKPGQGEEREEARAGVRIQEILCGYIRGVCLPFGRQRDTWFDE